MGGYRDSGHKIHRLVGFFFTQKIGEYAYGFNHDAEEEVGGDSLTIYGSTLFADAADFIKAFPQYTLNDYLYTLSAAQIQFLAVDNTHTKYLKGRDKKAWEGYGETLKAQNKLENFLNSKLPNGNGEWEAPVKNNKKKKNRTK